jgi:hypothetical protein
MKKVVIVYTDDGAIFPEQGDRTSTAAGAKAASPSQVAEGEAILADPGLPARRTAAWAAGGKPVRGAWAVQKHDGRLGKICGFGFGDAYYTNVQLVYAEDGAESLKRMYSADDLKTADLKAASPTQAVEGEAKLDALGASRYMYIFSRSEPWSPCLVFN